MSGYAHDECILEFELKQLLCPGGVVVSYGTGMFAYTILVNGT